MKEMTIQAVTDHLDDVLQFIDHQLEEMGCSMKVQMQVDVAVEELFVNIAHYAYTPGTGLATVRVDVTEAPQMISITFIDSGIPYNPLAKPDPDVTLSAEERRIGGLGIYMAKKVMDEVFYEYRDGQNQLTIRKVI